MPRRRIIHVAACIVAFASVSAASAQENSIAARDKTLSGYAAAQFSATRRSDPSTDRGCLPGSLKNVLATIENRFGRVRVISTLRPGARIAGTTHMSLHATCRAVDFHPAAGKYGEVLAYLRANWRGGIGTYSGQSNHLHVDVGHPYRWHTHLGGRSTVAARQPRRREATAAGAVINTQPY
jgi:uncharacterized protein YcbK (DUF882 family)